jgi:hypothetical protein
LLPFRQAKLVAELGVLLVSDAVDDLLKLVEVFKLLQDAPYLVCVSLNIHSEERLVDDFSLELN